MYLEPRLNLGETMGESPLQDHWISGVYVNQHMGQSNTEDISIYSEHQK